MRAYYLYKDTHDTYVLYLHRRRQLQAFQGFQLRLVPILWKNNCLPEILTIKKSEVQN